MNRRDATLAVVALGSAALSAGAQVPPKISRVGVLGMRSSGGARRRSSSA